MRRVLAELWRCRAELRLGLAAADEPGRLHRRAARLHGYELRTGPERGAARCRRAGQPAAAPGELHRAAGVALASAVQPRPRHLHAKSPAGANPRALRRPHRGTAGQRAGRGRRPVEHAHRRLVRDCNRQRIARDLALLRHSDLRPVVQRHQRLELQPRRPRPARHRARHRHRAGAERRVACAGHQRRARPGHTFSSNRA